jgi:hypothetical protein
MAKSPSLSSAPLLADRTGTGRASGARACATEACRVRTAPALHAGNQFPLVALPISRRVVADSMPICQAALNARHDLWQPERMDRTRRECLAPPDFLLRGDLAFAQAPPARRASVAVRAAVTVLLTGTGGAGGATSRRRDQRSG